MSGRRPAGGVGSNQYQSRGRPTVRPEPGRVERYAHAATSHWTRPPDILRVVDTRDVVEEGDRFIPIPGSGTMSECGRCGREHEVHVHVRHPDGTEEVVGTGCAGRGHAYGRKLATAATTVARLRGEILRREAVQARWEAAHAAVAQLTTPEPVPGEVGPSGRRWWDSADELTKILVHEADDDLVERRAVFDESWREAKARALLAAEGIEGWRASMNERLLEVAREKLERAEARLAVLPTEPVDSAGVAGAA